MTTPGYSALKGDELLLKYLVRRPVTQTDNPPSLVLLLHGVGGNESNLFAKVDELPDDFLVVAARAPFELNSVSFAWFQVDFSTGKPVINEEQAEKSRLVLKQFISQLTEKYQVDPQRIYLAGFSQGAIMSASVGLTTPEKIAGIALLSGRILPEIHPLVKSSATLSGLKVLLAHGTQDQKLDIQYARDARKYLRSVGITPVYHEYNMGHGICDAEWSELVKFLTA